MLVVAHDCTVLMLRHILDRLTEPELLDSAPVHNCSASLWRAADGRLRPDLWNTTGHLPGPARG